MLKSIVSFLLVLLVKRYTEKFKRFKKGYEMTFKTQYIFTHYYESCDKNCDKLRGSFLKGIKSI